MTTWNTVPVAQEIGVEVTDDDVIFLGYDVGSVTDGIYKGSTIIAAGAFVAIGIKRNGKRVGNIKLPLTDLFGVALTAIAKRERVMERKNRARNRARADELAVEVAREARQLSDAK